MLLKPIDDKRLAWFLLSPIDEWLFRDGKPFSVGDSLASTVFPPNPSVIAGAFRTFIAEAFDFLKDKKILKANLGDAWNSRIRFIGPLVVEVSEEKGKLEIADVIVRAPIVMKKRKLISSDGNSKDSLSQRRVVIKKKDEKDGEEEELVNFQFRDSESLLGSFNEPSEFRISYYVWYSTQGKLESVEWISLRKLFESYASEEEEEVRYIYALESSDIYSKRYSPHASIDRKLANVKDEGGYYTVEFVQLKDNYRLIVGLDFEGVESLDAKKMLSNSGSNFLLFLGGERKLAHVEYLGFKPLKKLLPWLGKPLGKRNNDVVALFSVTPLLFDSFEKLGKSLEKSSELGELISLAFERFSFLGGWDYAKNEPKEKKLQLRSGSTFFFKGFTGDSKFFLFDIDESSSLGYNLMLSIPASMIGLSENTQVI